MAAREYYEFLFSAKESRRDQSSINEYLSTLSNHPVDSTLSNEAEAPFTVVG